MKNLFIPLLVFIGLNMNITAQEITKKEVMGDKYAFSYSFDKAIRSYTKSKSLSIDAQRRLAESYRNLNQNTQAEAVYEKIVNLPSGLIPEDYYNYAMVLKVNGKYSESLKWMEKYADLRPNDLRSKSYIANHNKLPYLLKDIGIFKIEHLTINSSAEDFGTTFYNDKVMFVSSKSTSKMIVRLYNWNQKPYWDMYVAEVDGRQLIKPEKFEKKLNGKLHDGPAGFSNNGTFVAITGNNSKDKSKDKVVELQIFFSTYTDDKWSDTEPFTLNNNEYSVGQPCLTSDGKTMYFVSDMPGGYGGADLYRIKRNEKGDWANPENLGNTINTEADEMFPFIEEKSNKLFFTSTGHYGLGGMDIFVSSLAGSGFGTVTNMGYPLNTQFDDFAFIVGKELTKGYFSSNRNNTDGDVDLFSFDLKKAIDLDVAFTVVVPEIIPVERKIREYFPLRNYVFFNTGSTEIPNRYVLLRKNQVSNFKENQVLLFTPENYSGRSERQMIVYYNVLNILGDRMLKTPTATIKLIGASDNGPEEGKLMAESIKKYLTEIWGISAERIKIEGRFKPKKPSEQIDGVLELDLLREGDRRVSIESTSPEMLLEFQSGPNAPLKTVEILVEQKPTFDSYIIFTAKGSENAFTSWSLQIIDEKGKIQYFGPFTKDEALIQGNDILGSRPEGDYKVIMIGLTNTGNTVKEETNVHLTQWTPPSDQEVMRFSIIFEFDESAVPNLYDKYLTNVVVPKIPINGTVIIHGYTDNIGNDEYNKLLSLSRANNARTIIQNALWKRNRNDVKFEVFGFGEDPLLSPFDNKFPEERFYNRTVIIDVIPAK
jgi:outer membrane protein OmpA-like peptidoglycan-associated protein